MLKFFRRIRKKIVYTGNPSKYIVYAVGEILLIVMGILIALQVSNWNEGKKLTQKEINTLQDLRTDLLQNISNNHSGIETNMQDIEHLKVILRHFENELPYSETLNMSFGIAFQHWTPDLATSAYENLKIQGKNLISNDTLRKKIIEILETQVYGLQNTNIQNHKRFQSEIVFPMVGKYFYANWKNPGPELMPLDYATMMKDKLFFAMCTQWLRRKTWDIRLYNIFNNEAEKLIKQIDEEIERLDN